MKYEQAQQSALSKIASDAFTPPERGYLHDVFQKAAAWEQHQAAIAKQAAEGGQPQGSGILEKIATIDTTKIAAEATELSNEQLDGAINKLASDLLQAGVSEAEVDAIIKAGCFDARAQVERAKVAFDFGRNIFHGINYEAQVKQAAAQEQEAQSELEGTAPSILAALR